MCVTVAVAAVFQLIVHGEVLTTYEDILVGSTIKFFFFSQ